MKLILQAIKALFRKIELMRTHWDTRKTETITLTFDGNLEGKEVADFSSEFHFAKVSDEVPAAEEWVGGTVIMKDSDGAQIEFTIDATTEDGDVYYITQASGIPAIVVARKDTALADTPLTKGVWFLFATLGGVDVHVASASRTVVTGELKKLDEKYMPDGVSAETIENAKAAAEDAAQMAAYDAALTLGGEYPTFITGSWDDLYAKLVADVPVRVRVCFNGSVDFIERPVLYIGYDEEDDAIDFRVLSYKLSDGSYVPIVNQFSIGRPT